MNFRWLTAAPLQARRALLAASLGWALDAFDVFLYALILPAVMAALHLSKAQAGLLGSVTLLAAAAGGLAFGVIADRYGRTRALIASVLLYAVFTAACGLAWSLASLAVFRIALGFGMGGEWASGASLVADTWPLEHRSKALGVMQSSFALGYGLAAIVAFVALPLLGWRGVFFLGILPAALTLWVRRNVQEPESWVAQKSGWPILSSTTEKGEVLASTARKPYSFRTLFQPPLRRLTVALTAMNACCLFAFWGFNLWVPAYLSLPVGAGGTGFSPRTMTVILVVMQAGMWLGYLTFGFFADAFGRKRTYVVYLLLAAALLGLFSRLHSPWALLALAPLVAFTGTGYFTGFAAVTADIYATPIRATAQGFTYNTGRVVSAAAPFLVGALAGRHGFSSAFLLSAGAFVLAAALWALIPETGPRRIAAQARSSTTA